MAECWCGSDIDESGFHLTFPEGNGPWSSTTFSKTGNKVTHTQGNSRQPQETPSA